MADQEIGATDFKARCLALLDQVAESHHPLLITKRGRPVARLVPADDPGDPAPLEGSVSLLCDDDEAYFTTGEAWEASGPADT